MRNANRMKSVDQKYRDCANAFAADVARLVDRAVRQAVSEEIDRLTRPVKRERPAELEADRRRRRTTTGEGRRGRKKEAQQKTIAEPPAPPPLFVHKRAKDGRIESLVRSQAEREAEAKAAEAKAAEDTSAGAREATSSDNDNGGSAAKRDRDVEENNSGSNGSPTQAAFPFIAEAE